ncbi:hypothetical protein [Flavobacterium sp. LC2016-12]|uniref:hypothetical protein n=1 Tax=Flavobacterium sp. LC2016-12 TaxID=2783794 RepID=UPI001889E9DD|nr:hypothetical protein [Flavobacterium sp. LC2016-12]MBF4465004.1 hypothetical protein [Flavobacterium sp. LC2016-12]
MHRINYNKFNVILYFTGGILFYVAPTVLLFLNATKSLSFIPPIILILIGGYFYFRITKAFLHIIINKPMIVFTKEEYIDNFNGVNVKWKDIKLLSFEENKSPFVVFYLDQNSLFYNQITNPLILLFYKFEAYSGKSFRTNIC